MRWYGRGIVVAHGCQKRKKLICGPEGELVVAHGRLPSPALPAGKILEKYLCSDLEILHCKNVSLSYQMNLFFSSIIVPSQFSHVT